MLSSAFFWRMLRGLLTGVEDKRRVVCVCVCVYIKYEGRIVHISSGAVCRDYKGKDLCEESKGRIWCLE